jgi:hypothetical protein
MAAAGGPMPTAGTGGGGPQGGNGGPGDGGPQDRTRGPEWVQARSHSPPVSRLVRRADLSARRQAGSARREAEAAPQGADRRRPGSAGGPGGPGAILRPSPVGGGGGMLRAGRGPGGPGAARREAGRHTGGGGGERERGAAWTGGRGSGPGGPSAARRRPVGSASRRAASCGRRPGSGRIGPFIAVACGGKSLLIGTFLFTRAARLPTSGRRSGRSGGP